MEMFCISESPICDSSGSVKAMRQASVSCSLKYSGPRPAWEVTWRLGDRKLSGINSDIPDHLNRELSFIAFDKDSGVYKCSISSQKPSYSSQCSVTLHVEGTLHVYIYRPNKVCKGRTAEHLLATTVTGRSKCEILLFDMKESL